MSQSSVAAEGKWSRRVLPIILISLACGGGLFGQTAGDAAAVARLQSIGELAASQQGAAANLRSDGESHVPTAPTQWTILVYVDGDNNLEGAGIGDFLEMSSVGSNADMNIVVLFDRIPGYDSSYGDWTDTRRGIINPGDVPDTSWGASIGEANMGDPLTLLNFVQWGVTNYPASKYAIVLWNHGGGWRARLKEFPFKAVCWDDTNGGDCLLMKEVREALADAEASVGQPDLVGFDACLMGMVEVAYEVREHGSVMAGSEETEPGDGWPYDTVLADLAANPSMSAAALATSIVDRYYESYGGDYTQSAADLAQMDALAAQIDTFAQTLRDNWSANPAACVSAAANVMAALSSTVIHEHHGPGWAGSHGLAIYFPATSGEFSPDYNSSVILFPGATRWEEFLQDYYASMGGSWVATARSQSQQYAYPQNIDLYHFCERLIANAPDDLLVAPEEGFVSSGPVGGPFSPDSKTYTLTNTGASPLDWTASATQPWLDAIPGSGTLGAGAPVGVTVSINANANSLPMGVHSGAVDFTNVTSGVSQTRGVTLRVGLLDYFTELFDAGDNDLDNLTLTLVPDGSANFYSAFAEPATAFPTDPSGGTPVSLSDDSYAAAALGGGTQVFLYGTGYSTFYIGSNGYITFTGGDTDYSESIADHFDTPRISALFDDLLPNGGSTISWKQLADRVAVTYENVPEIESTAYINSFQIEMFFDGRIRITWLGIAASDGLAGVSKGLGVPADFAESDLSAYPPPVVDDLSVAPLEGFESSGYEGGPFTPESTTYTLTNAGASPLDWTAGATQPWLTVAPGSGTLAPADSVVVDASINATADSLAPGEYTDTITFTNTTSGVSQTRQARLTVEEMPEPPYPPTNPHPAHGATGVPIDTELSWAGGAFQDDMESGENGWTATGLWHRVDETSPYPESHSPTHSWWYGQDATGNYNTGAANSGELVSPEFEVPAEADLTFWSWEQTESAATQWDTRTVWISTDGGANWTLLYQSADNSSAWRPVGPIDLSAYAAQTARIKFAFDTIDAVLNDYRGWYVDDVQVGGGEGQAIYDVYFDPFSPPTTLIHEGLTERHCDPVPHPLAYGTPYFWQVVARNAAGSAPGPVWSFTTVTAPGEIEVTDSIAPPDDLAMPFGDVIVGQSRTETITVSNTDPSSTLTVTNISLGASYREDFDDGQAQGWHEDVDANWEVVSGEYRAQSAGTDFMTATYAGKTWDDLSAQMTCRREGSAITSAAILLRASADFDYGTGSGYVFQIITDGSYGVWKQVSGAWSWLQSWTASPAINPGANVLTASAEGSALKFYINGTLVWSGSDSDLSDGRIGLGGYTEPGYNTAHFFDEVSVGQPITIASPISPEQQWLNERAYAGGTPEKAPADWRPAAYPGRGATPSPASPRSPLAAADFQLENLPSLPLTLSPGASVAFDVIFEPTSLGLHESAVVIESNDLDEPETAVLLSGTGLADYLEILPDEPFEPTGHPGGPFTPSQKVYTLTNRGPVPIDWQVDVSQSWATGAPAMGHLGPGESTLATVALTAEANALPEGAHGAVASFFDVVTGLAQPRGVTLTVFTAPAIWTDPTSFTVRLAQGTVTTRTLTIGNAGDGELVFSLRTRQTGYTPSLASPVAQIASGPDSIVLDYTFGEPTAAKSGEYDEVAMEGLERYQRVGAPIVPVRPVTALVPYGKKVASVRAVVLERRDLAGTYRLEPGQKPHPLSYVGPVQATAPDPRIYGQAGPWPGFDHEDIGVQSKRGYQLFTTNLFPLQYTPLTGRISYAAKMRLEIELADADRLPVLRPSGRSAEDLTRHVDNPAAVRSYPPPGVPGVEKSGRAAALLSGGPYEYVIVTSAALEGAAGPWNFQALREEKTLGGVSATIVTTEWIYANYDGTRPDGGTDNQTRIRNFLIDAYQTWGASYALLGGVNSIVPARQFWVDSFAGEIDQMPVDIYYGCVEPAACTFDNDADGLYGEPTDGVGGGEVDLYGEISVGRAAVQNAAEVANFVQKTLAYEATAAEYLPRITMLGEYLGFGGVSDYATASMEQIRLGGSYDGYFTYGFENHPRPDFIEFDTAVNLYDSPTYSWAPSELLALMNGGAHVFNHLGHANETYSMKLYTSDLGALTNTDYFFVYSQGCYCGCFDTANCFAEELTARERGAFATIMNARYGWGAGNSTDGPSQRFDRQYWDAVLGEDMLEMGRANQDSKEDNLWDINGACIRWCYYELNLFGDPQQPFRFVEGCDWLRTSPSAGTAAPAGATAVDVGFHAETLSPGLYEGEIRILSNDPTSPTVTVPAALTVVIDDLALAPPEDFESSGPQGGPFSPDSKTYTLTNNGASPLDWEITASQAWLTGVPDHGTLGPAESVEVEVQINSNADALAAGSWPAEAAFRNLTSGISQTRPALLEVRPLDHFVWNPIDSPQFANAPFPATLAAVDAMGQTVRAFEGSVNLTAWVGGGVQSSVVVTELDTSDSDKVEFTNVSGQAIDISGWQITVYDWASWPGPQFTFTIPGGVACGAGEVFLLRENGAAPGSYPTFYSGTNIYWNNGTSSNPVALLLRDASGNVIDFVCAVNADPTLISSPVSIPAQEWVGAPVPANANPAQTYQRVGDTDNNGNADWNIAGPSIGFVNSGLTVPFAGGIEPIAILPTVTSAFLSGVWTGSITALEGGNDARLKADDGALHEGLSNSFDVLADTQAPEAPDAPTDDGDYSNTGHLTFTWTAPADPGGSGVASYDYQIATDSGFGAVADSGTLTSPTTSVAYIGSSGNAYYCRVRATDKAANTGAYSPGSDGILVDSEPPLSTVTGPSGRFLTASTLTVTWTAEDLAAFGFASGIQSVAIYWNRNDGPHSLLGIWDGATHSAPFDVSAHGGNGVYGFYSIATDAAGNAEAPPAHNDVTARVGPKSQVMDAWHRYE